MHLSTLLLPLPTTQARPSMVPWAWSGLANSPCSRPPSTTPPSLSETLPGGQRKAGWCVPPPRRHTGQRRGRLPPLQPVLTAPGAWSTVRNGLKVGGTTGTRSSPLSQARHTNPLNLGSSFPWVASHLHCKGSVGWGIVRSLFWALSPTQADPQTWWNADLQGFSSFIQNPSSYIREDVLQPSRSHDYSNQYMRPENCTYTIKNPSFLRTVNLAEDFFLVCEIRSSLFPRWNFIPANEIPLVVSHPQLNGWESS